MASAKQLSTDFLLATFIAIASAGCNNSVDKPDNSADVVSPSKIKVRLSTEFVPIDAKYEVTIINGTYDFSDLDAVTLTKTKQYQDISNADVAYDKPRHQSPEIIIDRETVTFDNEGTRQAFKALFPNRDIPAQYTAADPKPGRGSGLGD